MKRMKHLLALLLLGAQLLPVWQSTAAEEPNIPTGTLPAEAMKLGELLRAETAKISQQYAESLKALPAVQLAQLAALQKKLQDAGDLDGYLLVNKEVKRFTDALKTDPDPFEKIPEMPESSLVDKPESLRAIQDQYIKAYKDKNDVRGKRVEDLVRGYLGQMDNLKANLTMKGRIHEAIAVKKEIERVRGGLDDKSLVPQVITSSSPKTHSTTASVDTNTAPEAPVYGKSPEWTKWQFDRTGSFTTEGNLFAHPDLPDQLNIDFMARTGRGRIYGRCEVEKQTVDMREYAWFGRAIQWKVKDFSTLNTTISLQSKEPAAGPGYGPKALLLLLSDKGPIGDGLEVTMTSKEVTLTIAKDAEVNRCTLGWVQGKVKKTVELPATGTVRVLFGIAMRNLGERCDTTIIMQ